nr:unnamed protein product [Callosobruchus analis]
MSEPLITVNTVLDCKPIVLPYTPTTTCEDICINLCKQLNIGAIARHLFALRITGKNVFLMPAATFGDKPVSVDFRMRFKVASIDSLKKLDMNAFNYYFHQARGDVLNNRVPDIIYEKYKRELVGLGITDMYRVMLEKDISRESVENDYKKYIPKEVLKRHAFFIKRPIHDTLGKLQKSVHDAFYVKEEYIRQLEIIAPEYLSEVYKAVMDDNGAISSVYIKVSPYHPVEPGIKYCLESKKEQWILKCTIEELGFISIRNDSTTEISRKNGIPFYLKFSSMSTMYSFISLLDGYYRLTCKWIFNICREVYTPSLKKLYAMKCHGPVGGQFSYAKLESKRSNKPGCFIIRESESKYNHYYIDVCMKDGMKPKTFKLEKITGDEFIFNDDLTRYKSIQQLMAAYSDPNGAIYLQECLPPSEYDISPLLLCRSERELGVSALDVSIPTSPLCISCKDLQVRSDIEDKQFPERSMKSAKNHCRNPTRDPMGPWCYTMNYDLEFEACGIPLCSYSLCKITGPGMEYAGKHGKTVSAHWSFYCSPPHHALPPPAVLPECSLNAYGSDYKGTQDVTSEGLPCLPWSGVSLIRKVVDPRAASSWCFTTDPGAVEDSCNVRDCDKSEECTVVVDSPASEIYYAKFLNRQISFYSLQPEKDLLKPNNWTKYELFFNEGQFRLAKNGKIVFVVHDSRIRLVYWFTVFAQNGWVFLDHGTTTLAAVNAHHFASLNESLTGEWKCVVEQKDLRLKWVTNYLKINVKKAPNLFTNLMEDKLTAPIFGWMKTETNVLIGIIMIILLTIALVAGFLVVYFKFCTLRRYKKGRLTKRKESEDLQ